MGKATFNSEVICIAIKIVEQLCVSQIWQYPELLTQAEFQMAGHLMVNHGSDPPGI